MKKSLRTMIISLLLILSMPMAKLSAQVSTWNGNLEPWTHGTGTEADPFLIENAQQLAYLAYRVNNGLDAGEGNISNYDYHYKLMVDVNLNGSETFQWVPIGCWWSEYDFKCFGGHFDGNNHSVFGLYINGSANTVGLFGYTNDATVKNLKISGYIATTGTGLYLDGWKIPYIFSGGIIGVAHGTTVVHNCSIEGTVSASNTSTYGGVGGYSDSGGIIGLASDATIITNCYCIGSIYAYTTSSPCPVSGGIVGAGSPTIVNCYNTGYVLATDGLAGGIVGSGSPIIKNCYNTGSISGWKKGGIVGGGNYSIVTNSYFLSTCGGDNSNGGHYMSADDMKSEEFVNVLNDGGDVWIRDIYNVNQGYPIFSNVFYIVVTTSNATNITQTHSTLHGGIYTTGSVSSCGFEYRKATDMAYQAIIVLSSGNISHTLSGLYLDMQYYYRTFCTTIDGRTFYGEEKTFTTLPVSITTYSATNVTANSAILNGSISIGDAPLVNKGFEYREEGGTEYTTIMVLGNDDDFNAQITELQLNTTYEYRAFMIIADVPTTYYGTTRTFEVTWLNLDTICINNVEMLRWVSEQCNSGTTFEGKCIKLMNDITLPLNVPNNMTSIGTYPNYPFKGTFDGNGKLITNLYIDQPNTPYQGFFGYTLNANLYNVGLVNITASGRNYTGGMVAYAKNTHMRECYVNGGTLHALSYCGGLVGYQEQGTNSIISGCYNTCEVTGTNYVGGLIGFSNYSTVRNSYVAGRVAAQGEPVGAIIGGANEVLMYYCYFSTEITGQTNAIGENNTGGGKDGGEGLTNAQMRDPQFVNTLNQGLVTPVWMADYATHINNGFPIIKWQRPGTGVEENVTTKNYISLYPNPTNGFVTIQSDDTNAPLQYVEIYDVIGREVMSEALDGQSQVLNIAKLLSGVYHVRVQTDNGRITNIKLVVQ